jgi:uncharacterized protein
MARVRDGTLTLVSSPALIAEFADVIGRPKFKAILSRTATDPALPVAMLRRVAEIVDPPPLPLPVSRDQDDDAVLAVAVASRADLIISGDADLLVLATYAGIPITDATKAIALIGG